MCVIMIETFCKREQELLTGGRVVADTMQTASLRVIPSSLKLPGNMITQQWLV